MRENQVHLRELHIKYLVPNLFEIVDALGKRTKHLPTGIFAHVERNG